MKYDKIRRGGINYHGLTGEQAAEAAGRIVLENGLTESEQVDAAVQLVKAFDAGEPVFSEAVLQNIESRSLPDPRLSYVYRPRKVLVWEQMDHAGYVTSLLPPADIDSFDNLGRELLGCTPDEHARQLASMRDTYKDTHAQLVTGNAMPALEQIRGHNELVPEDRDKLAETVGRHIKLFAIQTARDRADALAQFAKQPSGTAFAGFTTWKMTGHIILATGAAPAKLLHRMIAAEARGSFEGLSDRQTIDKLVALGIFRATHAEAVGALAVLARKGLCQSGRHQKSALFKRLLPAIGDATALVAELTQRDMKDAGFSRMSITEYRYGLSPSEITTYLGLELRQVGATVDELIDDVAADVAGGTGDEDGHGKLLWLRPFG